MSYVSILLAPHWLAGGDPPMAFPAINIFSSQRNTKGDRRLAVMKRKRGRPYFLCPSINRLPRIIAPPPPNPLHPLHPLHPSRHLLFLLSPPFQVEVESDPVIKKCAVYLV